MRTMRKMLKLALMLVAVVTMSIGANVFAADTGKITINPPAGTDASVSTTYVVYRVFDAVGNGSAISYKRKANHTDVPAGFSEDTAGNVTYVGAGIGGNLTDDDIQAIIGYVTSADKVGEVTVSGVTPAVINNLPNGYYYITTTTGAVVTIHSTNPDAEVNDKNTAPTVDKKITGANSFDTDGKAALAQVGTDVTFSSTVTVGKGAKNYIYHDVMSPGLLYNNDVSVKIGSDTVASSNYSTVTVGSDTITVTFDNDYIASLNPGTKIVISYTAKITSAALSVNYAKNTARVTYGNNGSTNSTPTSETKVYNAKFTVTKKDGGGQALGGAGFVLKNAAGKFYKLESNVVSWVDSIDDATEYTSAPSGAVTPFTGLANGSYTLVEKTVPPGYNKAADLPFVIEEHDYTQVNLEQAAEVTNNAGSEFPSTGGIGTRLFYIVGAILVIGAGVVLITRRRLSAK